MAPTRTKSSDLDSKERLIGAAIELMLEKGYTATSVDEICAAAGLTKGSFFHHFEGKEALGCAVAEHFYAGMQQRLRTAAFHAKKDPLERVLGFCDFAIEMSRDPATQKGCLLGTFVQELATSHPAIRDVCATCFDDHAERIAQDLEAAKAAHAPDARWSPKALSEHLLAVLQGSIIVAKARQDHAVMAASLEHFKEYLAMLCERPR